MNRLAITFFVFAATLLTSSALDRVSVNNNRDTPTGDSWAGDISDNGNIIVFSSHSTNLVPGDSNMVEDIFVFNVATNTISLISNASGGGPSNGASRNPRISGNGRYVVFESEATNLDGQFVDGNNDVDVYRHDLNSGTTSIVSISDQEAGGTQDATSPTVNTTGQFVAFISRSELVEGTTTNFTTDVFVRDMTNGTTKLVSIDLNGDPALADCERPHISGDGNLIVFDTQANLETGTNGSGEQRDVYLRNVTAATTQIVSVGSANEAGDDISWKAAISDDGTKVAFTSEATTFVPAGAIANRAKIFLRDLGTNTTTRITNAVGGGDPDNTSELPRFSANGQYLVFQSGASDLLAPGTDTNAQFDIYLHEFLTASTTRISQGESGEEGSAGSYSPSVSNDMKVVFDTRANEFSNSDSDSFNDVYATINRPTATPPPANTAAKASIKKKIKKVKKALRKAKRSKNAAKKKRLKKKLRKLKKRLKAL